MALPLSIENNLKIIQYDRIFNKKFLVRKVGAADILKIGFGIVLVIFVLQVSAKISVSLSKLGVAQH